MGHPTLEEGKGFWSNWSGHWPDYLPRTRTCNRTKDSRLLTAALQAIENENLSSLLSTCTRLGLIGYQGKTEEMLKPSLSPTSTQVDSCFAKTINQNHLWISFCLYEKGSGTNGHEINCVMCNHGTGDQFDALRNMHLHKFAPVCFCCQKLSFGSILLHGPGLGTDLVLKISFWLIVCNYNYFAKSTDFNTIVKVLSAINEHKTKWTFGVQ